MTTGAKVALASVAALVLAVSVELAYIHHRNVKDATDPGPNAAATTPAPKLDPDEMVVSPRKYPSSLKDERDLIGKTIWVSAGDQMDYYKATGKHADYAHPVGTLGGATELLVKDVFEQMPPATGRPVARITAGQRHVLLAFTLPKSDEPKQLYAVPVGHYINGGYEFLTDDIFFYEDPHTLYSHWSPEAWAHIEKHEAAPGMTERQVMMALGQTLEWHGDKVGDRSITYNNGGHPVNVTFEHGKATKIEKQ